MSSVPDRIDGPVAVIGDVHGQIQLLRQLIGELARTPDIERRWIVFVGDLIDRGPDSAAVVELFFQLRQQHGRVTWVCGNHEYSMLGALGLLPCPDYVDFTGRWVEHYGARETFESYGVEYGDLDGLRAAIPQTHLEVMVDLPWAVEHPSFLFVHAGLDPNFPFETQLRILRERDYTQSHPPWMYTRDFLDTGAPLDCPATVVVGHVPQPQVRTARGAMGIDTGAGHGGPLSCVLLPEGRVFQAGHSSPQPPSPASGPRGIPAGAPFPPGAVPGSMPPSRKQPWWKKII